MLPLQRATFSTPVAVSLCLIIRSVRFPTLKLQLGDARIRLRKVPGKFYVGRNLKRMYYINLRLPNIKNSRF